VELVPEPTKSGIEPDELPAARAAAAALPGPLARLMSYRPRNRTPWPRARCLPAFAPPRRAERERPQLDTLSMGMSGDFEPAIAEGATLVRIGTALSGADEAGQRELVAVHERGTDGHEQHT